MIPKIIHITWKDRSILTSKHEFPKRCIQSVTDLSTEWDAELSTDKDVEQYLESNLDRSDYLRLKDKHIVEKTDVWRLIKMYKVGGMYIDIDRMCNVSINDIIKENTKCVLPTSSDSNFSHDFMCSAPGNPIFQNTLELNLERRAAGNNNIYYLGPQTYMHGITKAMLGEIVDVNPGEKIFEQIRRIINKLGFVETYRETSVYNTILYRENEDLNFDHENMKRDFYKESDINHWTGEW